MGFFPIKSWKGFVLYPGKIKIFVTNLMLLLQITNVLLSRKKVVYVTSSLYLKEIKARNENTECFQVGLITA